MNSKPSNDAFGRAPELSAVGSWHALLTAGRREETASLLLGYAVLRRWFRGKARRVKGASIEDVIPIAGGGADHLVVLLRAEYEDGGSETYVLPLGLVARDRMARVIRNSPHAVIATVSVRGEGEGAEETSRGALVDALATEELATALLDGLRARGTWSGEAGELRADPLEVLEELAGGGDVAPRLSDAEQSNTSIFYGSRLFLKVFRRIEEGPNADYEIGRFLTEGRTFQGTARLAGGIEYRRYGRETATFAMLQELIPNKGDAWQVTLESLDQFFGRLRAENASGQPAPMPSGSPLDSSTEEPPPRFRDLVGGYLESAARLGERTAELHLELSNEVNDPVFAPEPFSTSEVQGALQSAEGLLTRGFSTLRERLAAVPEQARRLADAVLVREEEVRGRLREVTAGSIHAVRIRCHGDFHLGQVLAKEDGDFVIIDFEGEPGRPLAERRRKSSPLRDVAGMLRSFHYAGASALRSGRIPEQDTPALEPWAEAWTAWVSGAFLRAYLRVAAGAPFLPVDPSELRRLLDFYLLDKCVYEIGYELNNRPDWLSIPLRGLSRILGPGNPGASLDVSGAGAGGGSGHAHSSQGTPASGSGGERSLPEIGDSLIGDMDLHLFHEGTHARVYEKLGAHPVVKNGVRGVFFAVWAPNAERVSVIGDFNGWDASKNHLSTRGSYGIWEGFIPGVEVGSAYKYHIASRFGGYQVDKADPFAFRSQLAPATASIVWDLDYTWSDDAWMQSRAARKFREAPMSIYEVHLGSWMRVPEDGNRSLTYREIAPKLSEHVRKLGFTHVELMPLAEHPFYGSWGYETTGYFAATSRYGTPQDLMFLIDTLHRDGIGVILDWVPGHFPTDEHGLGYFDGTHLFEHADVRLGFHQDWKTFIFNYGRHEVRSFLISNALFWLNRFHVDGLRVDGVASMLYLDYGRREGEWIPNAFGGRENLEAVNFLRQFNDAVCREHPDVQTIAEESTAWPMVSRPTHIGGLGFSMKWDMGWMHDTLDYLTKEPIHRKYHHNLLTFRPMYAWSENFTLPLSHDEVVHGKGSLLRKMNGDTWQRFANLRLLFTYMWAQPGKKMLFMGNELAPWSEWNHDTSLDWHLADQPEHGRIELLVGELNRIYKAEPSLHQVDFDPRGFSWIDANDSEHSVLIFERRAKDETDAVVIALNFTPLPRWNYRVGVPRGGLWQEILNTDAVAFGGSGHGNFGGIEAVPVPWHGRPWSINLTLPPLGAILLKTQR